MTAKVWREFEPGEATVSRLVFEDAWFPLGVKENRLADPAVPGSKAVHMIAIEEAGSEGPFEIATDGERFIFLDSVPSPLGGDQFDWVIAEGDPPATLTTGDRDRINRLIVYHFTKLVQFHLKGLQQLPAEMAVHMTRYIPADEAFYDCG